MTTPSTRAVLVGVDGSPASDAALDWATAEAVRRHRPLHVCSVGQVPSLGGEPAMYVAEVVEQLTTDARGAAQVVLDAALSRVASAAPRLELTSECVVGVPAAVLVERSARVDSIVVGHRGLGVIKGALLGSVAHQVAGHAACPVVVVRGGAPSSVAGVPPGGVVVGVDGSAGSEAAVGFAFEEAALRGCDLHVVKAWWTSTAGLVPGSAEEFQAAERLAVAETLAGWGEKYPDVTVHVSVPMSPTVMTLVEAGRRAELLVVGSRGLGGFRRLVLGSVSHGVLQHAFSPVAVVGGRPD